jgi:hypothetical protein
VSLFTLEELFDGTWVLISDKLVSSLELKGFPGDNNDDPTLEPNVVLKVSFACVMPVKGKKIGGTWDGRLDVLETCLPNFDGIFLKSDKVFFDALFAWTSLTTKGLIDGTWVWKFDDF